MRKFMKKAVLVAGVISMAASLCLTGCGGSGSDEKTAENSSAAKGESVDLPVIKMITMTGAKYDNSPKVVEEINKILAEKAGAQLELTWLGMGDYMNQTNLMLTGDGEVDIALLNAVPLATYAANGQLLDISSYYEGSSEEFLEWLDEAYIDSCRVEGKLYAIPEVINFSNEIAVHVNKAMIDDMGIEIDDAKIWTMDEIHDLVLQAMEKYPNIYGIVPMSGSQFLSQLNYDSLGDSYFIGVIEDHGTTGEVISVTDCQEFIDFSSTMRAWYQEGLIMQDCMSNTEGWSSMIQSGKAFACFDAGAFPDNSTTEDTQYYNLTLYPNWSAANCAVRLDYGIAANTKNPELAFAVLKEMYTNTDICNLLLYGIEGENYVLNEEGKAALPEGVTLENNTYSCGFANPWVLPNMMNGYESYQSADGFAEKIHEYDSNAIKSGALGCVFDSTDVTNEYSACINVFNKYYYAIMSGSMDTESTLKSFKEELKTAGEDKVIAEKQKQLDEFLGK